VSFEVSGQHSFDDHEAESLEVCEVEVDEP